MYYNGGHDPGQDPQYPKSHGPRACSNPSLKRWSVRSGFLLRASSANRSGIRAVRLAAVAGAYIGFELRKRAAQHNIPNMAVALAEDAIAVGSGLSAMSSFA